MINLQTTTLATPATILANPQATEPAELNVLPPWIVALQAALSQHVKPTKQATTVDKDLPEQTDTAVISDDKNARSTNDNSLAIGTIAVPLVPQTAVQLNRIDANTIGKTGTNMPSTNVFDSAEAVHAELQILTGTKTTAQWSGISEITHANTLKFSVDRVALDSRIADPTGKPPDKIQVGGATISTASLNAITNNIERNVHGANNREPTLQLQEQGQGQFNLTQLVTQTNATPASPLDATQLQTNVPIASAAWGAEAGQKIIWMVGEKLQRAELRVNPPELGPIQIRLTINDQQTNVIFTSPHEAVRDAMESSLPRLREVLAESGISLGNASVTSDSPRDGQAFSEFHNETWQSDATVNPEKLASAQSQPITNQLLRRNGLVDLFA